MRCSEAAALSVGVDSCAGQQRQRLPSCPCWAVLPSDTQPQSTARLATRVAIGCRVQDLAASISSSHASPYLHQRNNSTSD